MSFKKSILKVFVALLLIPFLLNISCGKNGQQEGKDFPKNKTEEKNVKCHIQMGWIPDAHQVGFWVALEKGIYMTEGLDLEIFPGGLDTSPSRAVATGAAEFGQISGVEQLITARESGLPIQLIAAIHQESPHALISLNAAIKVPNDVKGKRIAVAFGDAAEIHFKNMLKQYNIEISDVKLVPFRFNLQPLIDRDVDAVTGFSTDQPMTLKYQGYKPTILAYRDFGIHRYGYCLILKENNEKSLRIASKFLKASREGWKKAFDNPDEAVNILMHLFPGKVVKEIEIMKMEAIRPIMLNQEGVLSEWKISSKLIKDAQETMLEYGQIKSRIDIENSYINIEY